MEKANWHIYQLLTKRSSLLQKFLNERYPTRKTPAHMWFGVSVENEQVLSRVTHLQKTNASIRFLSIGLDHGVGHFRPLIITRQRHLLVYRGTAMSHACLCQVF